MNADRGLSILAGSDLHNSRPGLEWFCHLAEVRQPQLVAFLGDFVTRQPLSFIKEVLATLRDLAPAVFIIPGNWDPREVLVETDAAAYDGLRNLHKHSAQLAGYDFAGLGGSITTPIGSTPFESPDEGFAAGLMPLLPADVWLLHNPVHGYRDLASRTIHAGSQALAALWRQQEPPPLLVLSGHIHEAAGWEQARGTTFVNPGSLASCSAAAIQLLGGKVDVQILGGQQQ